MKLLRRIFLIFMAIVTIANCCVFGIFQAFAHQETLDVSYDKCVYEDNKDGMEERWYRLNIPSNGWHYGDEETTITYRFEDIPDNSSIFETGISATDIVAVKTAYTSSMKKWNNVYFYSYNSDGTITKNKVINIVEADPTDNEWNITIRLTSGIGNDVAVTSVVAGDEYFSEDGVTNNKHYSEFLMEVNVDCFFVSDALTIKDVFAIKEKTGAHEIGHVLGLIDIDKNDYCEPVTVIPDYREYHHEELLMGYGEDITSRAKDITYKDIAGVAITRGFHTDDDHKWLHRGSVEGKKKLICSICNGVKYVDDLSGYVYDTYGECNNNHKLEDGNMMAVASYGNEDYYKCKYCRYVAPFSYIEEQDYSATPAADGIHHICTNNVTGLSYSFLEEHTWVDGECSVCGYEHPHTWEEGECTGCGYVHPHMLINGVCAGCGFEHDHDFLYMYRNGNYHFTRCDCGYNKLEPHFIRSSQIVDGRYANCLGCGRRLDLWKDIANVQPTATSKFSVNGSYILPNGIVVLVDEDIEAYMNGTLVFYNRDDIPTVE